MSNSFYQFVARHYNLPVTFDADSKNADLVKSLVPYDRFTAEIDAAIAADATLASADRTELMVVKLLAFFKNDFFTWVDGLECEACSVKAALFTVQSPSEDLSELLYLANSVEIYKCPQCGAFSRFPRYNDPRKLLTTRRGRCGEWANCFAYILRCLDIQCRLVYCTTDHVWVEFYNSAERRWIHADPCENELDNPLMYQIGWGKVIDLVVARGEKEIRDVTWRYTAKWKETAQDRQRKFSEGRLAEVVQQWNGALQGGLGCREKMVLQERWIEELVEFIRLPGQEVLKPKERALQGRTSGSLAWRLSRAETSGVSCTTDGRSTRGYAFKLRKIPGKMVISYDCNQDSYLVKYPDDDTATSGSTNFTKFTKWHTCVAKSENIFRNVEHDWKMAYLARNKGSRPQDSGLISWRFEELIEAGARWTTIEAHLQGDTFQNGSVDLVFCCGKMKRSFDLNRRLVISREEAAQGQEESVLAAFEIEARLSGGNGEIAWQHGQLFRQMWNGSTAGEREETFKVTIWYQ